MINAITTHTLGFLGPIGWQELLCCAFPVVAVAIILIVLVLTGVIGGKKNE
jgi:uncharacterized membrane protein YhdT